MGNINTNPKYLSFIFALLTFGIIQSVPAEQTESRVGVAALVTETKNWLSVEATPRFAALVNYDFKADPEFARTVVPYLRERGVLDEEQQVKRIRADFYNLGHALTVMFAVDPQAILSEALPADFFQLFDSDNREIDHVGRELFGPLSFYLAIMQRLAPSMGLTHAPLPAGDYVTNQGDLVFPSTGVIQDLREIDPALSGVTVGRIYFHEKGADSARCVELFQSATMKATDPQQDDFMLARSANLYAGVDAVLYGLIDLHRREGFVSQQGTIPLVSPLSHIALRVRDIDTVYAAQRYAKQDSSGLVQPYIDKVSFNAADASTNSKVLIRNPGPLPLFNTIVEIVHYQTP
ncbi:MAG: hypothetical protein AAGF35_13955 [Pseudomonadota bacterium]